MINKKSKQKFKIVLNFAFALCITILGGIRASAEESEPELEEILIIEDFDEEDLEMSFSEENSDSILHLEKIDIETNVFPKDMGKGTFETPIQVEGNRSFNEMVESIPSVFGDQSSKGTRNLIIRGYDVRQFSLRFEGVPLDTGYDSQTGLDSIPALWIGSGVLKRASAGAMDTLGLGAGIELNKAEGKLFGANIGLGLHGFDVGLGYHGSAGKWAWSILGGGEFSEGWELSNNCTPSKYEDCGLRDNTDAFGGNLMVSATRKLGDWGSFDVLAGWMSTERGVAIGVGTVSPNFWRFPTWDIVLATTKLAFSLPNWYGQLQLWGVYQGNTLVTYDDKTYSTQEHSGSYISQYWDYDAGFSAEGGSRPWSLGSAGQIDFRLRTELRYQNHLHENLTPSTNNFYYTYTDRLLWNFRPGFYWKILENLEIFASGTAVLNAGLVKPDNGLKGVDVVPMWNGEFSFGLDWLPLELLRVSVRAARRVRMPTLKEQYERTRYGNQWREYELRPELAWDFQLLFDYQITDKVHLSLSGFDSEIRDLIQYKYIDGLRVAVNVFEVRLAGADVGVNIGEWFGLSLDLSYAYLFAWNIDEESLLNERPAHSFRARLNYAPLKFLKFGVTFQFESERLSEDWSGKKVYTLGNIFLLGADAELKFEHWSLLFKINNILDLNYSRAFGYPEEGRSYYLTGKVNY